MSSSWLEPMGLLSRLPDPLLSVLCSFLRGRDRWQLGAACTVLHRGPHCLFPSGPHRLFPRLRLSRENSDGELADGEDVDRARSALSVIARRATAGNDAK